MKILSGLWAFIKSEPLLSTGAGVTSLVGATMTLLPDFGVHLSAGQVSGITGVGGLAAVLISRTLVTPNAVSAAKVEVALNSAPPGYALTPIPADGSGAPLPQPPIPGAQT